MKEIWLTGLGQDSHRFVKSTEAAKPLRLAGISIPDHPGLQGNSDADVVLHALCNAITSLTGVKILGGLADRLCNQGVTDSTVYFQEALRTLDPAHNPAGRRLELFGIAISIEAKTPHLAAYIAPMQENLAALTGLDPAMIGITATSGEGLTSCGQGLGMAVICTVSACEYRE